MADFFGVRGETGFGAFDVVFAVHGRDPPVQNELARFFPGVGGDGDAASAAQRGEKTPLSRGGLLAGEMIELAHPL